MAFYGFLFFSFLPASTNERLTECVTTSGGDYGLMRPRGMRRYAKKKTREIGTCTYMLEKARRAVNTMMMIFPTMTNNVHYFDSSTLTESCSVPT